MKYLKYIIMSLVLVAAATSCSDRDVEFPWEPVDTSTKAFVQIMYMGPVASVAANNIYKITLNNQVYVNNGAAIMSTYNGTPGGGTGLFYTVDAGDVNIKLWKSDTSDGAEVYNNKFHVEAGKYYSVVVHLFTLPPTVIERGDLPVFITSSTVENSAVRFYNFMFEDENTPSTAKLQLRLQNTETKEYEPVGKPVGFGEATEWLTPTVIKTSYNSSGSQRRDLDVVYTDGSPLAYTNSKGNTVAKFTDYWTLAIGRGYQWFLYGTRGSTTMPLAIRQWTAN